MSRASMPSATPRPADRGRQLMVFPGTAGSRFLAWFGRHSSPCSASVSRLSNVSDRRNSTNKERDEREKGDKRQGEAGRGRKGSVLGQAVAWTANSNP